MYKDSYDIPAYKFGFIMDYSSIDYNHDTVEDKINTHDEGILIPFEDLDGLTLAEIKEVYNFTHENARFRFICYYGVKNENRYGLVYGLGYIVKYCLNLDNLYENSSRIDRIIELKLMNLYASASADEKKVFKCFFERYQDKTHEETVNRVYKMRGLIRK